MINLEQYNLEYKQVVQSHKQYIEVEKSHIHNIEEQR